MDDIYKKQKNGGNIKERFEEENRNLTSGLIKHDHALKRSCSEGDDVNKPVANSDNFTIMMQRSDNNYAQITVCEGANVNVHTATFKLQCEPSTTTTEPGAVVNRNVHKTNMLEMHFENLLQTLPL